MGLSPLFPVVGLPLLRRCLLWWNPVLWVLQVGPRLHHSNSSSRGLVLGQLPAAHTHCCISCGHLLDVFLGLHEHSQSQFPR